MQKMILLMVLSFFWAGTNLMQAEAQEGQAKVTKKVAKDLKSADIRVGANGQHYANGRRLRFFPTVKYTGTSPAKYKKFELYYSRDKGSSWSRHSEVEDLKHIFEFDSPQDGHYYFATVATDELNQVGDLPKSADDSALDVVIDTQAPTLKVDRENLSLSCRAGDTRTINWSMKDSYPRYVRLEYFNFANREWKELANVRRDQEFFSFTIPNIAYEEYRVRLKAFDQAGNQSVLKKKDVITFNLGPLKNIPRSRVGVPSTSISRKIKMVLDHEGLVDGKFKDYEVWYSTDNGVVWHVAFTTAKKEIEWTAPMDGHFSFYSIVRTKDGGKEDNPSNETKFKASTLVDTKKPQMKLSSPMGGVRYTYERPLVISWYGIDSNTAEKPVKIEISHDSGLNYEFVADGDLSGQHNFSLVGRAGHNFKIRLSAIDKVGNRTEVVSDRFSIGALTSEEEVQLKAHFHKANAYRVFGRWKEALKEYIEVLRYDVQYHPAVHDMGVVYMELKDYEKAVKHFQRAVSIDPENTLYLFNLGLSYYKHNWPRNAEDRFKKVLEIDKDYVRAHWYLAEIQIKHKELDKAREHLEKILKIHKATNKHKPLAIAMLKRLR
jgi:hypothetical protein